MSRVSSSFVSIVINKNQSVISQRNTFVYNEMTYREKLELIKSLSDEPQSVSDEQASLAYDRLVQLYTLLIKAKRDVNKNFLKVNTYVEKEK